MEQNESRLSGRWIGPTARVLRTAGQVVAAVAAVIVGLLPLLHLLGVDVPPSLAAAATGLGTALIAAAQNLHDARTDPPAG